MMLKEKSSKEMQNDREFDFTSDDFSRVRKLIYQHAGISLSEAKSDMQDVRWQDLAEVVDREKEFKFQSTMVDKYVAW